MAFIFEANDQFLELDRTTFLPSIKSTILPPYPLVVPRNRTLYLRSPNLRARPLNRVPRESVVLSMLFNFTDLSRTVITQRKKRKKCDGAQSST